MPNGQPLPRRRLVSVALSLGIVIAAFYILSRGENFFVPLVIAFIAVYLVAILGGLIRRLQIGRRRVPKFLSVILSFAIIVGLGYEFIAVVANNASHIAAAAPRYQARFQHLQAELFAKAGIEESPELRQLIREIDLRSLFTAVAKGVAGLVENITLVFIYGLFILLELRFVPVKFQSLFPDPARRQQAATIFRRIDKEIHTYLGVKTAVSFATALLSYLLMRFVGLDFAEFWALLIFVLHFIPTVGVIVATLLPTILAAVQFQNLGPFLGIGIGLTAIAQLMGSIVEPNLMGETLNLSPLAVIMALIFWGTLWGVTGAFLCVPLTVILVIVMSNFESTRWVAVLLSKTGVVHVLPDRTDLAPNRTGEGEGSERREVRSER
jgi:AI-2 transport protein TqsA